MDMSIWYLVGAALVFFMQAGFAMVEAGFTRAKNAGNIIMKNLMDFCIGTAVFILFGYGIMNSSSYIGGFIGTPEYGMFTDFEGFNYCIWRNGRKDKIQHVLHLFSNYKHYCIPG